MILYISISKPVGILTDSKGFRISVGIGVLFMTVLSAAAALMVFVTAGGLVFLPISAFILGFFPMSAPLIGLQVSAELVGSSMTGTAASVLWLFSQIGSVVFIVLMESVKAALGSFQYSILVLVALDLVAMLLYSRITETGKRVRAAA